MQKNLTESGYKFSSANKLWCREEYASIAYSDGTGIERKILQTLEQSKSVNIFSKELKSGVTDWPTMYHLSSARSNVLRPFEAILQDKKVLEIGAGCGAITRFLGETAETVLAVEGSKRRATIARERTRDLSNVYVVADNFESFQIDQKFDVITLIGVLEYAKVFINAEDAVSKMLNRVTDFLAPNGCLIVAIENQLGLKYFAGAPEDHTGEAFYGIEGRYGDDEVVTFGRLELERILQTSGFGSVEMLAPFPDYKMAYSILTSQGFSDPSFNAASLAYSASKRDFQTPQVSVFSQERAWPAIIENGIGLDMANSFIAVASLEKSEEYFKNILAFHYSTERAEKFCKSLCFYKESGQIKIKQKSLAKESREKTSDGQLEWECKEDDIFIIGENLFDNLVKILTSKGWLLKDIKKYFEEYVKVLQKELPKMKCFDGFLDPNQTVDGKYIDYIPQNIIRVSRSEYKIFDQEWTYNQPVVLGWLLFRALLPLFSLKIQFGESGSSFENSRIGFILAVFDELNCKVDDREISKYAQMEREFQSIVTGIPSNWDWESSKNIPVFRPNVYQTIEKLHHENNLLRQMVSEQRAMLTKFDRNIMVRIWRKMKSMC